MLAAVTGSAGHPAVAGLLGLGAVALAGLVVAMTWSVHVRQIRLAELLARRQPIVTAEPGEAGEAAGAGTTAGAAGTTASAAGTTAGPRKANGASAAGAAVNGNGRHGVASDQARAVGGGSAPVIIDGPDTVVTGEQVRYRLRPYGSRTVVSWAAGGGSLAQSPDPEHPDELLLVADQPGSLMVSVRVREGMMETRGIKTVTAVPEELEPAPPVTLRLFLHGWGLIVASVLIAGFAAALDALGNLSSSAFIALVTALAALLCVVTIARKADEPPSYLGHGATSPPGPKPGQ